MIAEIKVVELLISCSSLPSFLFLMVEVTLAISLPFSTLAVSYKFKITTDFYDTSSVSLEYPRKKSFRPNDSKLNFLLTVKEETKTKLSLGRH